MGLGTLVLILVCIAIGLGLLNKFGPEYLSVDGKVLKIINIVVIFAIVIWLLFVLGVVDFFVNALNQIHVGRR